MTIYGKLITGTFLLIVGSVVWYFVSPNKEEPVIPTACTMEAKICPDGSAVGRTGPMCEFAACPVTPTPTSTTTEATTTGSINGYVTLSPTCPVETTPPDPNCAPKPFVTTVRALDQSGKVEAQTETSSQGFYLLELPVGTYTIEATSSAIYPRCMGMDVTIKKNKTLSEDISCDSGIR